MTEPNTPPVSGSPGRIVVGVDGSDSSTNALRRAIKLATAIGARVVAVSAWSYPASMGFTPVPTWSPENDAVELLEHVQRDVFGEDVPAWFSFETHPGPPAQVLIQASTDAEMLVVGNRGRGGFKGLLLGSVSATVTEYAECPVLVYHDESREVLHREPGDHAAAWVK
jgi:nucleotide-binding universal stress UspA family protein